MKRIFDLIVSLVVLIILLPIFILISIVIVFTSRGGVFFRGERVGKNGKNFKIFKFRSMKVDSEGNGKWNVGNNDPRVTKVGIFLRKTKLDELPQLINVIKGDMSLVGPRPELRYYIDKYSDREMPILDLRPGVTDWASLVNIAQFEVFTKAEDPDVAYEKYIRPIKLNLQLYYRYNHSFFGDFEVLIWTVIKVLTKNNKLPKKIKSLLEDSNGEKL